MSRTQNDPQTQASPVQEALPMRMDVKIHSISASGSVLANASVTLNGCFAVRGVKVMNSGTGPFVSMPRYKSGEGYRDVCFPCTKEFHQQFQQTVLDAYQQALVQVSQQRRQDAGPMQETPPAPQMTM